MRGLGFFHWTVALSFTLLSLQSLGEDCVSGFDSFKTTVYPKIRRDCALCHDGSRSVAPPFATTDVSNSYSQLVSYMNFSSLEESLLVVRAGNGHCNRVNCQAESGREMNALAAQWWEGGEKTCERNGRYFTEAMALPEDLPGESAGFKTLSFDLAGAKPELKGITLQIDVQNYMDKSSISKGAYRFRSPRLIGGKEAIYIKDLKILLNGKYDVVYNAYSTINRNFAFFEIPNSISATAVLSAEMIIMLKDSLPLPKISVSFVEISKVKEVLSCENSDLFKTTVLPVLNEAKCATCHNSKGETLGQKLFDCTAEPTTLCNRASSLVDPFYTQVSPMIVIPSKGLYEHPQLTEEQRYQYVRAIKTWLNR